MAKIAVLVQALPHKHRALVVDGKVKYPQIAASYMVSAGAPSAGLYLMTIETVKTRREANARIPKRYSQVHMFTGREFGACYLYHRKRAFYGRLVRVTFTLVVVE